MSEPSLIGESAPAAAVPPRSRLRWNILANLGGNAWNSIISLFFVPLYIHYLGIEAWGLVGFFVTLQGILVIADAGLSTTLTRELARTSSSAEMAQQRRDLLRTLEVLYWSIAAVAGMAVILLAPLIATRWLQVQNLAAATVRDAIRCMGLVVILQLPMSLYSGGLLGLQQHVRLNAITFFTGTVRSVGMLAVLALISPTVLAYFLWQLAFSGIQTAVMAWTLWKQLDRAAGQPVFQRRLLRSVGRFSAGMFGIMVTSTLLTQADKVVLSRIVALTEFGYYALASVVAGALLRLVAPLFLSFFPRLTELVAAGDTGSLRKVYHDACQLATVLLVPAAIVLVVFSREVIFLWTHNAVTAEKTHLLVTLLVIGSALNGLMYVPSALQLAHGWTRLPLLNNLAGVVMGVPLIVWLSLRYGAPAAAAVWIALNAGSVMIAIPVMHRRLLRGEMTRWYVQDVAIPAAAALAAALIGRRIFPASGGMVVQIAALAAVSACVLAAAACAASMPRQLMARTMARLAGR